MNYTALPVMADRLRKRGFIMAGEKILVVDKVKKMHVLLRQLLEPEGYRLLFAESGREAVSQVMTGIPDIMLLEVDLPDMSGFEVIKVVKQFIKEIQSVVQLDELPVVVITSDVSDETRVLAKQMGVAGFFHKPIVGNELKRVIKEILRRGSGGPVARKLILCVDSETRVQRLFKNTLTSDACEVITAEDGFKALEMVEYKQPDLILLEINIPVMDGLEFLRELQELGQDIPVIVVSNVTDGETIERTKELGVRAYLTKPIVLEELKSLIRRILQEKSQEVTENA